MIVVLLATTLLMPITASADTNLTIGGTAVVAYANGDDVRLRDEPGYSGAVLDMVSEGASVEVTGGPFDDGAGGLWYAVIANGVAGYLVADYLALESPAGGGQGNTAGAVIGSRSYVDAVFEHAPQQGYVQLDPDTAMNPHSLNAALRAAGAGVFCG